MEQIRFLLDQSNILKPEEAEAVINILSDLDQVPDLTIKADKCSKGIAFDTEARSIKFSLTLCDPSFFLDNTYETAVYGKTLAFLHPIVRTNDNWEMLKTVVGKYVDLQLLN